MSLRPSCFWPHEFSASVHGLTIEKIKLPIIHINELLHRETLAFFKKQEKKGTSVVDCSNVVIMRRFQIPTIFSFDGFYSRQADLTTF